MDEKVLTDLRVLTVGGDETDATVVQPFGDRASLTRAFRCSCFRHCDYYFE
jgi:hypothetical protein